MGLERARNTPDLYVEDTQPVLEVPIASETQRAVSLCARTPPYEHPSIWTSSIDGLFVWHFKRVFFSKNCLPAALAWRIIGQLEVVLARGTTA